jgi:hypothetical protein
MPSSYQVVLWKQESFVVLRPLQIEFFRNLLDCPAMFQLAPPRRCTDVRRIGAAI